MKGFQARLMGPPRSTSGAIHLTLTSHPQGTSLLAVSHLMTLLPHLLPFCQMTLLAIYDEFADDVLSDQISEIHVIKRLGEGDSGIDLIRYHRR